MKSVSYWMSSKMFGLVHRRNLVYNQCWEDPRIDRQVLNIGPKDNLVVITSAGCNILDYLLDEPKHIFAIDMNPRQNALLELKIAAMKNLDYEEFFQMFGQGALRPIETTYRTRLRPDLPPYAREYWDRKWKYFEPGGWRPSFYFHGTTGLLARILNHYVNMSKMRDHIEAVFAAETIAKQKDIYERYLHEPFWNGLVRWASRRETTMSLAGVPRPQMEQIEKEYSGGLSKFIEDCIRTVFCEIPLKDNYFWYLYFGGFYTPERCPEYLKPENFERYRTGLLDRVSMHSTSILDFLTSGRFRVSKFVLLDHMDWMSANKRDVLALEWQSILNSSTDDAQYIWRSAGFNSNFVDSIDVQMGPARTQLKNVLQYDRDLAARLHKKDRVHTYGSFWIARMAEIA